MTQPHGKVEISNDDYHAGPGISKSHLDIISPDNKGCPKKYWNSYVREDREKREPTPDMILGTAFHTLVLEPETFDDLYVESKKFDRRTKIGKQEAADFEAQHEGKIMLDPDTLKDIRGMAEATRTHPAAGPLLEDGEPETSYYAEDPETGLLTKCRPDFVSASNIMVDLKSTADASPEGFAKSVVSFRYFVQAPWYLDVMKNAGADAPQHFVFVAVEKKPPYAIGVYYATAEMFDIGRRQARKDLRLLAECLEAGQYPDYSQRAQPLQLPGWFVRRISA